MMKLTALIITLAFIQVSAATLAQKVTLSQKQISVVQVLKQIHKQTGYNLLWSDTKLNALPLIDVDFKDTPLKEALDQVFRGLPFTYEISEKNVVIKEKLSAIRDKVKSAVTPPRTITGKILDENGLPLPGATVRVKGTAIAAITNQKGEFSINTEGEHVTLAVTFIGYKDAEWVIDSSGNPITLTLQRGDSKLDEVHVIAYGTTTQRLSVGSVTKVSATDITEQPVSNPLDALQGRVPGLTVVQTSGMPGASVNIQVRGQNSLSPKSGGIAPLDNPLIIIDGVPMATQNNNINTFSSAFGAGTNFSAGVVHVNGTPGISPFNSINPGDIESIEVLRDADATAIYGSRGANGVILITTKKGKAGKTTVSGNIWSGESRVGHTLPMMNTQQYLAMRHQAFNNDGITPSADPANAYYSYAPDLLLFDTTRNVDWKKYFLGNTAHTTDANVSISGGSTNDQFLVSSGVHHESYIFPGDFADNRASVNTSFQHTSTDKRFMLSFSGNYSYDHNNAPSDANSLYAFTLPPNYPALLKPDGSLNWNYKGVDLGDFGSVNNSVNPLSYLKQPYSLRNYSLVSSLQLSYQVLPGLTLRSSLGYTTFEANEQNALPLSSQDPAQRPITEANWGVNNFKTWNIEPQAEYKHTDGKGSLDILVGGTFQQNTNYATQTQGYNYPNDLLLGSLDGAGQSAASDSYSLYKYNAVFGRINYIWADRYILDLTGRRDGSSRFGPGKQFGNFGAAGAGWLFSEENLIKNALPWLSYGKLHASYGTTGNDNIGNYQYLSAYQAINSVSYQASAGYIPKSLYNPDFSWGLTKKLEAGLSLGLFKDRLLAEATWYRNRSSNQLVSYALPIQTGFASVLENAPYTVQNTGWEFTLNSQNIQSGGFKWSTSFNITLPRNKLLSFPGLASSPYLTSYVLGQSVNVLQTIRFAGVNPQTGSFQFYTASGAITSNPDEASAILGGDRVVTGNLDPKFYGGLRNSISYKGLQLDIFLEFKKQIGPNYLGQIYYQASNLVGGSLLNLPTSFANAWQKPGDHTTIEKFTTQYADAYNAASIFSGYSSARYSDASYLRLKTVSLSYALSSHVAHKLGAQSCRVYLTGQNLFTITSYQGNDPENMSFYSVPPLKTLVAGIQFTF